MAIHPYSYYNKRRCDPIIWCSFLGCVKLVLILLDFVIDQIFGLSFLNGSRNERTEAKDCYEKSAHIIKIMTRGTINLAAFHDETNFLYFHHSYVHPNYVLENKNVVLKTMRKDSAIFVVSDENVSVYDAKVGPFSFANAFVCAKFLIILPLDHLHRLAEEVGNPIKKNDLKVTIIHMTTRCGSTLLGQCLEQVGNTRVISEPYPFVSLNRLYVKGDISHAEYMKLLRTAFHLQCKIEKGSNINHIVMKFNPYETAAIPYLKEMFPEINLILNTRNLDSTIKSQGKIENFFPTSGLMSMVLNLQGERFSTEGPADFDDIKWWDWFRNVKTDSPEALQAKWMVFIWWGPLEVFRKNRSKYLLAITYEDLQSNPEEEIKKLLSVLNIDPNNTGLALKALEVDSQGGVFGQRGLGHRKDPVKVYDEVNKLFKKLEIPFSTNSTIQDLRLLIR